MAKALAVRKSQRALSEAATDAAEGVSWADCLTSAGWPGQPTASKLPPPLEQAAAADSSELPAMHVSRHLEAFSPAGVAGGSR